MLLLDSLAFHSFPLRTLCLAKRFRFSEITMVALDLQLAPGKHLVDAVERVFPLLQPFFLVERTIVRPVNFPE